MSFYTSESDRAPPRLSLSAAPDAFAFPLESLALVAACISFASLSPYPLESEIIKNLNEFKPRIVVEIKFIYSRFEIINFRSGLLASQLALSFSH
jgi:hypothetical protein